MSKRRKKRFPSLNEKYREREMQEEEPPRFFAHMIEIGEGPFHYLRLGWDGTVVAFRFQTAREVDAAMKCGMELDHLRGVPDALVDAIREAARVALD